jgi:hypothetical protein
MACGLPRRHHGFGVESTLEDSAMYALMRFVRRDLRKTVLLVLVCVSSSLAGCGNSCVVAYSVNGNGGVIVKGGDPPPVCALNQAQGMVRAAIVRNPRCEGCAQVTRVEHMFVLLRGIQIHVEGDDSGDWVDIAPELAASPRKLDLMGDSVRELIVTQAEAPAGTYDRVRLQFLTGPEPHESEDGSGEERCGSGLSNCLTMGDGRVEPLGFPGEQPEVFVRLPAESKALLVLPSSTSELQIRLGVQPMVERFPSNTGKPQLQIAGEVFLARDVRAD